MGSPKRHMGVVKSWSEDSGSGLITRDDGVDILVPRAPIETLGYSTLAEGQKVDSQLWRGAKE